MSNPHPGSPEAGSAPGSALRPLNTQPLVSSPRQSLHSLGVRKSPWVLQTQGSFNSEEPDSSSDEEEEATNKLLAAVIQQHSKAPISRQRSWGITHCTMPLLPDSNGHRNHHSRFSVEEISVKDEDKAAALVQPRVRSSYHLTSGQAAVELFLRLSRARQTVDFSRRQALQYTIGAHGRMSIWEALNLLNELREYEAVLFRSTSSQGSTQTSSSPQTSTAGDARQSDSGNGEGRNSGTTSVLCQAQDGCTSPAQPEPPSLKPARDDSVMSMMEHAFQTAELCRHHFPEKKYLHLAGLIHGLGKLLAHVKFGAQPQWAVCGESFPLGCRFASCIPGSVYFSANPDRRRRLYSTPTGMYQPACGLDRVVMSWGAAEYLYQVLSSNTCCHLPAEALFVLRHQKFNALARSSTAYAQLLSPQDQEWLPTLQEFQSIIQFRRQSAGGACLPDWGQLRSYYDDLINTYTPGQLAW